MRKLCRKLLNYSNYFQEFSVKVKTYLVYKPLLGEIGKKCKIFKPMRLIGAHNLYIGDSVRIYKNSRIETVEVWGQTQYKPKIKVGNGTSFEQNLHLICASKVEIGADVVVSANVYITDLDHSYQEINKNAISQPIEVKEIVIDDYCFIGMGSRVLPGTVLGKNCIVGANAVVRGKYPDYSVIAGVPAKIIKRYDTENSKWRKTNKEGEFVDEV